LTGQNIPLVHNIFTLLLLASSPVAWPYAHFLRRKEDERPNGSGGKQNMREEKVCLFRLCLFIKK